MRKLVAAMPALAMTVMVTNASQAMVVYADSDTFAIAAVTPVFDPANSPPQLTRIVNAYPNPFNPSTTIRFDLASDAWVDIDIFDMCGRLVKTVESGPRTRGHHQAVWHGTKGDGRAVPSGTYFCRIVAGQITQTTKILLAK